MDGDEEQRGGAAGALAGLAAASGRLGGTPKRERSFSSASIGGLSEASDVAGTIVSARGGTYQDVVEEENLCFVCFSDPPDSILLECGHAGMCCDCATRLLEGDIERAKCPICRAQVAQVAEILPKQPLPPALFRRGGQNGRRASPIDPARATSATALLGNRGIEQRVANIPLRGAATPAGSLTQVSSAATSRGGSLAGEKASGIFCEDEVGGISSDAVIPTSASKASQGSSRPPSLFPSIAMSASYVNGPPWPASAKQDAVCVQVIKKQMVQRPAEPLEVP